MEIFWQSSPILRNVRFKHASVHIRQVCLKISCMCVITVCKATWKRGYKRRPVLTPTGETDCEVQLATFWEAKLAWNEEIWVSYCALCSDWKGCAYRRTLRFCSCLTCQEMWCFQMSSPWAKRSPLIDFKWPAAWLKKPRSFCQTTRHLIQLADVAVSVLNSWWQHFCVAPGSDSLPVSWAQFPPIWQTIDRRKAIRYPRHVTIRCARRQISRGRTFRVRTCKQWQRRLMIVRNGTMSGM